MRRSIVTGAGVALSLIIAMLFLFAGCIALLGNPVSACPPSGTQVGATNVQIGSGSAADAFFAQFPENTQKQQKLYAGMIVSIGTARGRDIHDIQTALGAAIQESKLQNVNYGDLDSLGLFSMRPGVMDGNGFPHWGTASQIMDPIYAINRFYQELEGVKNRQNYSVRELAIEVEKPDKQFYYRDWTTDRDRVIADLVKIAPDSGTNPSSTPTAIPVVATSCGVGGKVGSAIVGDDYPYPGMPIYTGSPLGYYYRECVDFVAWRLNEQSGTTHPPFIATYQGNGNAVDWRDRLVAKGFKADSTPAVGAVAWWGAFTRNGSMQMGEHGHVAIVSAVHEDGSITIEQYNVLPFADHAYNKMELPAAYLHNVTFVHVADIKQ